LYVPATQDNSSADIFVELGKNINILTQCLLEKIVSLCLMYLLILKFL